MNRRIPLVIYVFALCAFALGFTELVTIGLVSRISADLHIGVDRMGLAVTYYALGAVVGGPVLTALAASWPRSRLMVAAMTLFTVGNVMMCLSHSLLPILLARFLSGLGHGVFLAVASSVAARLVSKDRAGAAVAVVFSGLTLALALGVPLGTLLGTLFSWHVIFIAVAASGALGLLGLLFLMPRDSSDTPGTTRALDGIKAIFNMHLLAGAGVTVLAFTGAFAFYTYISPVLLDVTRVTPSVMSALMLVFGVSAYIGNVLGGRLSDRVGPDRAVGIILIGLFAILIGIWLLATSVVCMTVLVGLLGAFTYASVPALQARLIALAHSHAPDVPAVAAGMNIAGFNGGIALGSFLGGVSLHAIGLTSTAIGGAIAVLLAFVWVCKQGRSARAAGIA